jgi:poly [ADP-ribose] polymerase
MTKLLAKTVYMDKVDGFDETIKWSLLMCSNVEGNNNKFYCIEIQKNSKNEYLLFSHYGRLRGSVVEGGCYDTRGPEDDINVLQKEYDNIIKNKLKGKSKVKYDGTKYTEKYEIVDVLQPTVGSANIKKQKGASATGFSNKSIDLSEMFSSFGKKEKLILNQLYQENVHQITSSTSMKMTSNGLETPLGPLTNMHLDKAKNVLDSLKTLVDKEDGNPSVLRNREFRDLNTQYFSLIPRSFGMKIDDSQLIFETGKIINEYDLLEQMKSALQVQDANQTKDEKPVFDFKISLADDHSAKMITDYYNSTKAHGNINHWKVANVYEVLNEKERSRYVKKATKFHLNTKNDEERKQIDLFHGTRNANVLSIMLNGFNIPPVNAPHVTGRMFGNGIYAANASTKALNYSLGNWNRSVANKYPNAFLFITRFAMGKIYETKNSQRNGTPSGFNSIFAKGGADLRNDEYIVPTVEQSTTTHLIELFQ